MRALPLLLLACTACRSRAASPTTSDELFRESAPLEIKVELAPDAMSKLGRHPRNYVRARVSSGGRSWDRVRVRFKGFRALESWAGKPAFVLRFGRSPDGPFAGAERLILNNMVEDPTMVRETLAYRLHREAGVPAPRTRYARVTVNDEYFGLYLLLEAIDENFLARTFGAAGGPVYEGEFGCDLYPEDVLSMDKESGEDPERAALAAFAEAAQGPIDRVLLDGMADTDRVLAYLAVSAVIGDFDGYRHGHNYRIYRDPASKKWSFIPWGLDRSFKRRLGVYDSGGLLAKKCFADRACRVAYLRSLGKVLERFEAMKPVEAAAELDRLIGAERDKDPRRTYGEAKVRRTRAALDRFLEQRPKEIAAALGCLGDKGEIDRDGDGHGCMDCDDGNPAIAPGAKEKCDGIDDDCSGYADDDPLCACPAFDIRGAVFRLCNLPMAWTDAAAFCEKRGQTLASIDDPEQSDRLWEAVQEIEEGEWWIGLSDREKEGDFRWLDGSRPRFYWAKGEPDNFVCGEDCGAFHESAGGEWRDMHCANRNPFICREVDPTR